jgi:hypothetical protein
MRKEEKKEMTRIDKKGEEENISLLRISLLSLVATGPNEGKGWRKSKKKKRGCQQMARFFERTFRLRSAQNLEWG